MSKPILLKLLLWGGSAFFLFETPLHFFGLSVLEHDKIFIWTHDRYIALYALTYAALLILTSTNLEKYRHLFILTMIGIFLGMFNAYLISSSGGYSVLYPVVTLDQKLRPLGYGAIIWYIVTWYSFILHRQKPLP